VGIISGRMRLNLTNKVLFEEQCVVDEAKVFYHENRVLRAIYNTKQAQLYQKLFQEMNFEPLYEAGLVRSKIATDIELDNCDLILEHEKVDFFLDPSEMTDTMFWNAALCFVRINKTLAQNHLILKDAHPWNITFFKGKPIFFDFSSIGYSKEISSNWFNEFYTYFAVPLSLSNSRWNELAQEYRRQHHNGFGLKLSGNDLIKKYLFRSFFKLRKDLNNPILFLDNLEKWILKYTPKTAQGAWDNYEQRHNANYCEPNTFKQKFVHNILSKYKPKRVADLASNKGYYAFMAESLGANVIGFDYEPYSVDTATSSIKNQNITFCQMNFLIPTSKHGWGLLTPDAFSRFHSDIALVLGLIHHVCLVQKFPVKLFCDSSAKYASKGLILEFVYPEDIHVQKWNANVPLDYNKNSIKEYFKHHYNSFEESEMLAENGIMRQFFFFYNN
jgi:hypothetical protein